MKLKKYVFTKVSSTNDIAMKKIKRGLKSGIIISSNQIRGRGRYGHKWISMKGNLFMSVFFSINTNTALKKLTSQCVPRDCQWEETWRATLPVTLRTTLRNIVFSMFLNPILAQAPPSGAPPGPQV